MTNEMMLTLVHSQFQNDDELAHYGILGMHWGIRRYQPYGEGGYDPDHEGKNIGLAARLAGHTGSYSDAIRRGSSFGNRAKATAKSAVKSFGSKAGKAAKEAYERADYAAERVAQGLISGSEKAKKGLAKYSSTYVLPGGKKVQGETDQRMLEKLGTKDLMGLAAKTFASNAKMRVSDMRKMSGDDIRSALGSGASRFQEAMSRTAVKSKEFGRNAAMTAALFGGALDPKSNASQTIQKRSNDFSFQDSSRNRAANMEDSPLTRLNPGAYRSEKKGGRAQGLHGDALDLAGRLSRSSYGQLSDTGRSILGNNSLTRTKFTPGGNRGSDSSGLSSGWLGSKRAAGIRSAGRSLTPGASAEALLSSINQKSSAPRWKGNDAMNTEARKRFATGELAELNSRSPVRPRGSTLTGLATKPYKDYNKIHPDDWRDLQEDHMDYRDRVKPSRFTRDKLTSKIGNMTNEKFRNQLEKRGITLGKISQYPESIAKRNGATPLETGSSAKRIYDKGTNRGVDREDVYLDNIMEFRNKSLPNLGQSQARLNSELKKRGVSFAMINQTPVPMIPKGQNTESVEALIKRLGIGTI